MEFRLQRTRTKYKVEQNIKFIIINLGIITSKELLQLDGVCAPFGHRHICYKQPCEQFYGYGGCIYFIMI